MHLKFLICMPVLITALLSSCLCETDRHIECFVYSDSTNESYNHNLNVVYIKASSDRDTIHYLWSSYRRPSVIISKTVNDTVLQKINFDKLRLFESGAIQFSKEPVASTGFTIAELWQNLYVSDTSDINEISSTVSVNLEEFQWKNVTNASITCSPQFARVNFVASGDKDIFSKGGTFEIEVSVSGKETAASNYPHLLYSGNSTQIKVVFNSFYSNATRVRYALGMSLFAPLSTQCIHDKCKSSSIKSVSDEFSPGIFTDITLLPPCSRNSFLSWRPVAYISQEPSVANSTDAKLTSECTNSIIDHPQSIAELFFSDFENSSSSIFNMTFGTKGDGFYPKTEYAMWSFMAGVGSSVGVKVSATAILLAVAGLGALGLFFVSGLIFIGVQKCRKKKEDELLLNSDDPVN